MPAKEQMIPSDISLLHEFIEHHAHVVPQRVALEFITSLENVHLARRQWTYAELNAAGDWVSRLIESKKLQLGDLVVICFDKCPEASFAMLGILKGGYGFVALDPDSPVARKQYIIKDSNAKLLLTTDRHKSVLGDGCAIPIMSLDHHDMPYNLSQDFQSKSRLIRPDSTCYCLYTSGMFHLIEALLRYSDRI